MGLRTGLDIWGEQSHFSARIRTPDPLARSLVNVLFYVLFVLCRSVYCVCVCKCVLYHCHRVATQLQLTLWRRNYFFFLILAHPVYKM